MTIDTHNKTPLELFGPYIGRAVDEIANAPGESTFSVGTFRKMVRSHITDITLKNALDAIHAPEFRELIREFIQHKRSQMWCIFDKMGKYYSMTLGC